MKRAVLAIGFWAIAGSGANAAKPDPTDAARLWLKALYAGNTASLTSLTSLPFTYRQSSPKKHCTGVVTNAGGLQKWLACAQKEEALLLGELRWEQDDPSHLRLAVGAEGASKKLRSLAQVSSMKAVWVSGYINGDGVTYELLLRLESDDATTSRVASLFIDASFDGG